MAERIVLAKSFDPQGYSEDWWFLVIEDGGEMHVEHKWVRHNPFKRSRKDLKTRSKKAPPDELSKLFKAFLQENSATCGVPSEVLKQVKEGHGKATEVGKKVCDAAAQGPRPATPSLADALGATPTVPDASA